MRQINNKKGAEMTIGTLVVIALAILVLVVLAFGFGTGWANLWEKAKGFFGGGVNVDSVKQACQVACITQRSFEYCCLERDVRFEVGKPSEKLNCTDQRLGLTCNEIDCEHINCQTK